MIYIPKYKDIFQEFIQIGEYEIGLPDPPDLNKIEGANLPTTNQRFRRTQTNLNGKYVDVGNISYNMWIQMPDSQKDRIQEEEWHKRIHGKFVWIHGKLVYIPGNQYTFCNYWKIGREFAGWRDGQNLVFLLIEDTAMDPESAGIAFWKGRRIGWTQMENFCGWEWASRVANTKSMFVNKDEKECKRINMQPIFHANHKMAHFFKPVHRGKEIPTGMEIEFAPDTEQVTSKKLKEKAEGKQAKYLKDLDALNSAIIGGATTVKQFDGQEGVVIGDEFGKWDRVDVNDFVSVHKKCAFSGLRKVGFVLLGSTIEEMNEDQIVNVQDFWDSCAPGTGANYTSSSWIRRFMWPFWLGMDGFIDEYGFTREKEAKAWADAEIANLQKMSKKSLRAKKELRQFKRKHPQTIEDALESSQSPCIFFEEGLDEAKKICVTMDEADKPQTGTLVWVNRGQSVRWVPNPGRELGEDGSRWMRLKPPELGTENNIRTMGRVITPCNQNLYVAGIDPYDTDDSDLRFSHGASKGALRIKRRFDSLIDGHLLDEEGRPKDFGKGMQTNTTQLIYVARPESTTTLYEDFFKSLVYYGCGALYESNKQRMKQYFLEENANGLLMDSNGDTLTKKNQESAGVPASTKSKQNYFDLIEAYVYDYCLAMKFEYEIDILKKLNMKNVTRLDYGAAFGFCEMADMLLKRKHFTSTSEKSNWLKNRIHVHRRK